MELSEKVFPETFFLPEKSNSLIWHNIAVFSAILTSVAINMSRFKLFSKLAKFGVRDSIVLIITRVLTIVFDLTYGVLGGVAITLLINICNFKKGLKTEISVADGKSVFHSSFHPGRFCLPRSKAPYQQGKVPW